MSESHFIGDVSRAIRSFSNLFGFFLNKNVLVETEGYYVRGELIHFQVSDKKNYISLF
jgi:hypothetical protein